MKNRALKIDGTWLFIGGVAVLYAFLLVGGKPLILCRRYYLAFPQDAPVRKQFPLSRIVSYPWDAFITLITDSPRASDRAILRQQCQPKKKQKKD